MSAWVDDAGSTFSNAFVTTSATASQSLIIRDISKSRFEPNSSWNFQVTPCLESFNRTAPTPMSTSQTEFLPQLWAFWGFENLPAASAFLQSAAVSPSIETTSLFAHSSDPNGFAAPSEDGRASNASSSHPPALQAPFLAHWPPPSSKSYAFFSMPVGLPRHVNPSSRDSSRSDTKAVVPSPEEGAGGKHKSRKRHVSSESEEKDDGDSNDNDKLVKRTAHSLIEKRYRTNITDNFAALRNSVPSLNYHYLPVHSPVPILQNLECDQHFFNRLLSGELAQASWLRRVGRGSPELHTCQDEKWRLAEIQTCIMARKAAHITALPNIGHLWPMLAFVNRWGSIVRAMFAWLLPGR